MRILLSSWGSRGDIEPLAALALRLRELDAEVRVCAPPDEEFTALFARVGVPLISLGPSTRSIAAGLKAPSPDAAFRLAAELVAARFATIPAAAEGCDALVATGLMPAGARDIAEKRGLRYVLACFHIFGLPSRHFPPAARPARNRHMMKPTTGCCGGRTRSASTRCTRSRSTGTARRSAYPQSTTSGITSSRTSPGWRQIRSLPLGGT
jgi:UDP:flavonoid glycosyltransferase YjiC (YdhE family)